MMGIPLKNRKPKVEKPRPLKLCTLGDQSLEGVLADMDVVSQYLNSNTCDRSVYPAVVALCENLKMFGPQLENVYKDQLDRCYISLRNGCRDDRLSLAVRYRLLEVIELRAMHWQPNENLINYYKQKLIQIEAEEAAQEDQDQGHNLSYTNTPTTPSSTTTSTLVIPGGLQSFQQNLIYSQTQTQAQTQPQTPTLLAPGEIIKNSGKFAKPTRIPGKNYCKDEVVIRNADSGKVMGIKGRRVHMIEELSETIISFQRVAPGARERLVQITGPAEDNINHAKQLIEETIRRNASPVRSEERSGSSSGGSIFTSLGGSSSSISSHTSDETLQGSKRNTLVHSQSVGEEPIGEYRYTVTRGTDALRITGTNLHLVRTAKLVLDEFFSGERNLNNIAALLGADAAVCDRPPSAESPPSTPSTAPLTHSPTTPSQPLLQQPPSPTAELDSNPDTMKSSVVTVLRQPLFPSSSKEAIENAESSLNLGDQSSKTRRALFQKTSEERANEEVEEGEEELAGDEDTEPPPPTTTTTTKQPPQPPSPPPPQRRFYTREFLVKCADSPLSHRTPTNWSNVIRQLPLVMKKSWQYLTGVTATLNEGGETAINGVKTYMKDSDLESGVVLASRELTWSLIRSLSIQEDDDNGNNGGS